MVLQNKGLKVNVALQIQKPPHEVFEAIIDPKQMTRYFISESTGIMEEGKLLIWRFPEFDEDAPVKVGAIDKDKRITFSWEVNGRAHTVEISLEAINHDSTVVRITETGGERNDEGILWLMQNTEGWTNFLACLKAWIEYGINLRKGGFDYLKQK